MGNLASRIIVAAILLPIAIAALWFGEWWLVALGVVAAVLAAHELWTIARDHRPVMLAGYIGVAAEVLAAHLRGVEGMVLVLGPVVLLTFILAAASPRAGHSSLTSMAVTVFGVVWIGVGLGAVVVLRDDSFTLVLAVLLGTWASDIGAYAIGRLIGRRKLAPAISPGKSVEGFVAGVVVGTRLENRLMGPTTSLAIHGTAGDVPYYAPPSTGYASWCAFVLCLRDAAVAQLAARAPAALALLNRSLA